MKAVGIIFCIAIACFATCTTVVSAQPNCRSLRVNGASFDLSQLIDMPNTFQTQDMYGSYEFRVCSNFVCGSSPSAACQETPQPAMYPLGQFNTMTAVTYQGNALVFTNSAVGSPLRGSTIAVICDPTASTPKNPQVVSPNPGSGSPYIYGFSIVHKSACISNPPAPLPLPPVTPGALNVQAVLFNSYNEGFCNGNGRVVDFTIAPKLWSCVTNTTSAPAYTVTQCNNQALSVLGYPGHGPARTCFGSPFLNVTYTNSVCLPDIITGNTGGGMVFLGCSS